jgi:NAD-reducing hydrogenase large subunit
VGSFGAFPSNHMSLVRERRARWTSTTASCAPSTPTATPSSTTLPTSDYHERPVEDVSPWSYMKFPFIRARAGDGWYRVGPLARMNTATSSTRRWPNRRARRLRAPADGAPANDDARHHWARMIEVLHCVEKIRELLNDPDLQGTI